MVRSAQSIPKTATHTYNSTTGRWEAWDGGVAVTGTVATSGTNYALELIESGVFTYVGVAAIGTITSAASWQIKRLDETTGLEMLWADGNDTFDNIWDNHVSLSYS